MRLRFIWIGKTRDKYIKALIDEYFGRLNRFVQCQVVVLGEARAENEKSGIEEESRRIIRALRPDDFMVLLDVKGIQWTSPQVAHHMERWRLESSKHVAFIVGGSYGVSGAVDARADLRWSLSRLTLTHELVRVVLLEQIYRALTIINRIPYHK